MFTHALHVSASDQPVILGNYSTFALPGAAWMSTRRSSPAVVQRLN